MFPLIKQEKILSGCLPAMNLSLFIRIKVSYYFRTPGATKRKRLKKYNLRKISCYTSTTINKFLTLTKVVHYTVAQINNIFGKKHRIWRGLTVLSINALHSQGVPSDSNHENTKSVFMQTHQLQGIASYSVDFIPLLSGKD